MDMLNKIALIYVNYQNSHETIESIVNILDELASEDIVVVVDNNSSQVNQLSLLDKFRSDIRVRVVFNEKNLGFSSGVNRGLDLSRTLGYTLHYVCNPDTRFSIYDVKKLINSSLAYKATVSTPLVKNEAGITDRNCTRSLRGYPDYFLSTGLIGLFLNKIYRRANVIPLNEVSEVQVVSGCFFLINDSFGEIVLDEDLFLYLEEFSLAQTLKKRKLKTIIDPSIEITHLSGRKSGNQSNIQKLIYEFESLSTYLSKYYPNIYLNNLVLLNFKLKIVLIRLLGR
jgi:GT2 family glycosyltransferase